eukprot:TRINITY_DN1551_c0_g1_i1.p1 TRINITY_DN1551_c0_g1~~TRINITY_DN1551_c0_g1_i1.p1  ORF type:complete len:54 (-),score=3.28 TRINITY_DN1551_c0_g1_i1:116-277(-)
MNIPERSCCLCRYYDVDDIRCVIMLLLLLVKLLLQRTSVPHRTLAPTCCTNDY